MFRNTLTLAAFALTSTAAAADGHAGTTGYALVENGTALLTMADIAAPSATKAMLDTPLRAIAWRPVTGTLMGFADGAIYAIDPATGATTNLDASFMDDAMIGADAAVALDFNNAIDAVRAVSTAGDNLVYFPDGFGGGDEKQNSVRRFTSLAYTEGDAMAGSTPMVFANAYTNAINGETAESTFQYALDAETDALISLANNAGTLETIAKVTVEGAEVDLAPMGGFDIYSPMTGTDQAYAILQMEGAETAGLYAIDLETGAASILADLGMGGVTGFAVTAGN